MSTTEPAQDDPYVAVGCSVKVERVLTVPLISARSPGQGHVGKWIDRMKREYDTIIFPSVVSITLYGMLERRGFKQEHHYPGHVWGEELSPCLVWHRWWDEDDGVVDERPS